MVRTIQIPGDQIKVQTDIGPGRILSATLTIEDDAQNLSQPIDPNTRSYEDWLKDFNEMCELAPVNQFPADVSREAMYLSDDEMGIAGE